MNKIGLLISVLFLGTIMANAQITAPAPSPAAKVEQRIGLTDISVEYSRPSKKGRVVFGDVVPYNEIWRTGANAATKITFSDDVTFGGAEVNNPDLRGFGKPLRSIGLTQSRRPRPPHPADAVAPIRAVRPCRRRPSAP